MSRIRVSLEVRLEMFELDSSELVVISRQRALSTQEPLTGYYTV